MRQKNLYEAPETEVLELRLEGVIATSDNTDPVLGDTGLGGGGWQ